MMRTAISPRLAIRIRLNIDGPRLAEFYTESRACELTVCAGRSRHGSRTISRRRNLESRAKKHAVKGPSPSILSLSGRGEERIALAIQWSVKVGCCRACAEDFF